MARPSRVRPQCPSTVACRTRVGVAAAATIESLEGRTMFAAAPTPSGAIGLSRIGTFETGGFDVGAAEITAYAARHKLLFVVNAQAATVDVLSLADPAGPTRVRTLDVTGIGLPNSVAVSGDLVAVALEDAANKQAPGKVAFFRATGSTLLGTVPAGALPDMLTFTPDGKRLLVANEGEPNQTYTVDPEGSVTVIDIPAHLDKVAAIKAKDVKTIGFAAFNGQADALRAQGVRVYGPGASVAQDFEPEYIAVDPDGKTAYVTLQENNAVATIDLKRDVVTAVTPLGFKDHAGPNAMTETFEFKKLPRLGTTAGGQDVQFGGFSGLAFEGYVGDSGKMRFITHTDRGPNAEPVGVNRPFLLPDFQPELARFELDPKDGSVKLLQRIPLRLADGSPLTGLPNTAIAGGGGSTPYNDEVPVDLGGNVLPLDPLGADLEGIAVAADGTFWMCDEYRPALYHFSSNGRLIERVVPVGTAAAAGKPAGFYGTEALPAEIARRRQNRGFEAIAIRDGKVYAMVQSPIRNPATLSNGALNAMKNVRLVEFDPETRTTRQFIYVMDNADLGGGTNSRADKIGDMTSLGGGAFLVVERDDDAADFDAAALIEKKVYRFELAGATDVTGVGPAGGKTVDQMTAGELAAAGVTPIGKQLHVDLARAGYDEVEKVEGLAVIDERTIAVINDNDFGVAGITPNGDGTFTPDPDPDPVLLGLVTVNAPDTGLDTSDSPAAINITNRPVFGMYQPDAIAAFEAAGETFLVTANEGDVREYAGFAEAARVSSLPLDPVAFPPTVAGALKASGVMGRLNVTKSLGDTDGDGDHDALYAFGARSFTIRTTDGAVVYDSGADFERITAAALPLNFNASNTNNTLDNRSDDKGPEPEGVALGVVGGRTYAFVGLERIGGVMVYDVTDPQDVRFVQYVNTRNFAANPNTDAAGDLGPEGLTFVPAADSPNGRPLLVVANEVSGTVGVFEVESGGSAIVAPAVPTVPPRSVSARATVVTVGQILFGTKDTDEDDHVLA